VDTEYRLYRVYAGLEEIAAALYVFDYLLAHFTRPGFIWERLRLVEKTQSVNDKQPEYVVFAPSATRGMKRIGPASGFLHLFRCDKLHWKG
jgi:hypothetical protein